MPTWNRRIFLSDTINSILNQDYNDWTLYIYDDGSTDGTDMIIPRDNRIVYFKGPHKGAATARNRLLGMCKTKYACWHDSDDISHPCRLRRLVDSIMATDNILLGSNYKAYEGVVHQPVLNYEPEIIKYPYGGFATTIFQVAKALPFNASYDGRGREDTDWLKRMYKTYNTNRPLIPEVLYYVRYHENSLSQMTKRNRKWPK